MSFAALILAAGTSRRMGSANKLLLDLNGMPLVAHVLHAVRKSRVQEICVVLGHEAGRVRAALEDYSGPSFRFVMNPDFESGLASSLTCGLEYLAGAYDGVAVCLGDMPFLGTGVIDALCEALLPGDYAAVPVHEGQWGNPVVLSPEAVRDAMALTGDRGARALLVRQKARVREVAVSCGGVLRDIDRERDLGLS